MVLLRRFIELIFIVVFLCACVYASTEPFPELDQSVWLVQHAGLPAAAVCFFLHRIARAVGRVAAAITRAGLAAEVHAGRRASAR
jgi:hypothetical protein